MARLFTPLPPPGSAALGAWYDEAAADAAVAFFPHYMRLTEGEWKGQPFELADWQADQIIRPLFGWKRADGTRLFRTLYVEVPRKNGKTEMLGGVANLMLVGDGEHGGQGYCAGVNTDQAKILFEKAAKMVGLAPAEFASLVTAFKTSIYCASLQSSLKPLSGNPKGKQGFNPSFAICDETHEWKNGEVAEAIEEGMGARAQPLMAYITTAGVYGEGFGWELHDRAVKVASGELTDPTMLVAIYAADPDMAVDDPAAWEMANPNYGVSVKPDFLQTQAAKAKESPSKENRFRRYSLNQWTESAVRWLNMDAYDACGGKGGMRWRDELPAQLAGRECYGGLDLSSVKDTTALVWSFPPLAAFEPWFFLYKFWLPEGLAANALEKRVDEDRLPYVAWRDMGALNLTPGDVVDYDFIRKQINDDRERFDVKAIGFDRWNSQSLITTLREDDGANMVAFGQGFASMAAPTKEFERLVVGGLMDHGGHPIARAQANATSVQEDAAGNMKPSKDKSTLRIDGTVAAIMALGVAQGEVESEENMTIPAGYRVVSA